MASELQRRLRERRERQELDRMLRAASEIVTDRTLTSEGVPDRVLETVRGFWQMSTDPIATLSDEVPPERLGSWVEELLARHGFHTAAFLFTDLDLAPWVEFRMPPAWFTSIRQATDAPWVFLAHDLGTVAAVSEQEYRFEFFVAHVA
ncbi:hypothetical protein [Streptomyces sp. NPDC050564]|uniref:hypothetical protein n=1 Tax=Streptomyces sp. NPDC050564 TaxID=3365631 RepID=UPI00378A0757